MKKLFLAACVFIAACAVITAASAAPIPTPTPPGVPATTFRYDDLDLNDPRDARTMLDRIRRAATRVCVASPFASGTEITALERFDACRRQSIARAVAELDAPRVTAAHEAREAGRKLAWIP